MAEPIVPIITPEPIVTPEPIAQTFNFETEEGINSILSNPKISEKIKEMTQKEVETFKTSILDKYVDKTKVAELEAEYSKKANDSKLSFAIEKSLFGTKHSELLKSQIKNENLKVSTDGTVVGINEEMDRLKGLYPDFFEKAIPGTPPAKKDNSGQELMTYEKYVSLPKNERLKVSEAEVNRMLKGE